MRHPLRSRAVEIPGKMSIPSGATIVAKKSDRATPERTTPVRLTDEAIKWARIASGYTGESMAQYVSRITVERGQEDADRLHATVRPKKGGKP